MDKDNALATVSSSMGLAVDAKLTPAQLIDLVMEEMVDEVDSELKAAEAELEELENKTFSFDDVKHILSKQKFHVNVDTYDCSRGRERNHSIGIGENDYGDSNASVGERDKVLGEHVRQVLETSARVNELRTQKQNIDGNKRVFRATIMKRVLEGTAEGRNVLAQIKNLKVTLRTQLAKKSGR